MMPILRLLVMLITGVMTVITLFLSVTILLGMGWLAIAVPVLVVIGIVAASRKFWLRYLGSADTDLERRD